MFGVTMISGVRGSPFGGSPGGLNNWPIAGPEKIWPMPAMLLFAGEVLSNIFTAFVVCVESDSQSNEMSSWVGPMPGGLFDGRSDNGSRASRMSAGDVVIGSFGEFDMPK